VARILQVADRDGGLPSDAALPLDDELAAYLAALSDAPAFAALASTPAAGETRIEEDHRLRLGAELEPLAARVRERTVPPPPDWVGLEGGTDIRMAEPLGWPGLLAFLQRLERLLHLTTRLGGELWVMEE
jgi:hypothetical protein